MKMPAILGFIKKTSFGLINRENVWALKAIMQCVWGSHGKIIVFIMFTKSQIAGVNFFVNLVDLDVWLNIWYLCSNILLHTLYFFVISSMVIPIP